MQRGETHGSGEAALIAPVRLLRGRARWRPANAGYYILAAVILAIVLVLTLLPIGRLLETALAPQGDLDVATFLTRIMRPAAWRATINTLDTSFFGALLAVLIGVPFTVAIAMTDLPGRRTLGFCLILPLMIAPQVTALAWLHLFGPSSTLLGLLHLTPPPGSRNPLLGRNGIILLFGIQHMPIVFVTLRAGLLRVPRDLVEAARSCGASPTKALLTIVLPAARPYLLAAFALAFVSGVGNFGIPALLGLPVNYRTLATLIYQQLSSSGPDVLPEVAALSVIVAIAAILGVIGQALATGTRHHRLEAGLPARFGLGHYRVFAAIVAWVIIAFILVLPAIALLLTSLVPTFGVPLSLTTVTLDNFIEVLVRQGATTRAFFNSFVLSTVAAGLLAAFAIPLGWYLERWPVRFGNLLRGIIDLPYAVPGIVLAIACILLFLRPLPVIGSLYATPWIILIAYLMRFLALAAKPVSAAIGQIPRALDEAAAASGARPLRRLATIVAPMALASAIAGALLVFMSAFNELTVSALLWSSGHETIGVVLFSLEDAGLGTQAAAIAVTSLVVVVALLVVVDRLGQRLPKGVLPWR